VESSKGKGKDMAAAFNASLELSRVPMNTSFRFGNTKNSSTPLGDCIVGEALRMRPSKQQAKTIVVMLTMVV
jgi:hypothetical protein